MKPDLAGFADAQKLLRSEFGEDIEFKGEVVKTWPPGTQLDPETGKPYDPVLQPTSSDQQKIVARCNVVFKAIGDGVESGAPGIVEQDHVMLITELELEPALEQMLTFVARDSKYKITAVKQDGIGPKAQRLLIYGRKG